MIITSNTHVVGQSIVNLDSQLTAQDYRVVIVTCTVWFTLPERGYSTRH